MRPGAAYCPSQAPRAKVEHCIPTATNFRTEHSPRRSCRTPRRTLGRMRDICRATGRDPAPRL
jgi:hypothetical protein